MDQQLSRSFKAITMAVLACLWLAPPTSAAEPGGDSPQEVFDRFVAGAKAEDWNEIAACMAPEGLQTMNAMFVAMGGMMVAFASMGDEMAEGMAEAFGEEGEEGGEADEAAAQAAAAANELEQKFTDLLAKHGIDEDSMGDMDEESAEIPGAFSSPALFSDLMQFMQELPSDDEESGAGGMFPMPEGDLVLEDLVIDGDQATASVDGEPGKFVRIDGRWYIDMDLGMGEEGTEMDSEMEMEMEMEEEAAE